MTFSEKLTRLRRREGMSQEQLADRLGVTRQSVSKWESGAAGPELGKLIALSELFRVSVDYLVKDWVEEPAPPEAGWTEDAAARIEKKVDALAHRGRIYSYTSAARFLGLPLVSVRIGGGRGPDRDNTAVGILAVGNFAVGIVPVGLIVAGLFPIGMLAFGGLALGMVAVGAAALGMVSLGYLAVGMSASGVYAFGTAAFGLRLAVGLAVSGAAAVGRNAVGELTLLTDSYTTAAQVLDFLKPVLREMWGPLREIASGLIRLLYG